MARRRVNGHDLIDQVWPKCAQHLEPALAFAGGTHSIEHVREEIDNGTAQLWPVGDEGAIVSEVVETPAGKRVCRLWLAGGNMGALIAAERVVSEWAKENDCDWMEIIGRKGWRKVLPQYEHVADVLRRQLRTDA